MLYSLLLEHPRNRYESVCLLLLYLVYCYAMYMNTVLEAWAHTLPIPFPVIHVPVPDENSGLVTYKSAPKGDHGATASAMGGESIVVEGLDPTLSSGMTGPYGQDSWDGGNTCCINLSFIIKNVKLCFYDFDIYSCSYKLSMSFK